MTDQSRARRTLVLAGLAHALHDGFTDMIYVLLPAWQAQFALGYGALAVLRALYVGALAALQVPSGHLARHLNARTVLVMGTLLSAVGYALAGLLGGLVGLCASLVLAGAGGSTQHPLASAAVSRAYGEKARGPLGTYNFAGDLGKATIPPAVSLLLTVMDWRSALWVVAVLGCFSPLACLTAHRAWGSCCSCRFFSNPRAHRCRPWGLPYRCSLSAGRLEKPPAAGSAPVLAYSQPW